MTGAPQARPEPTRDRLRLWLRLLGATRGIEGELRARMRAERTTLPRFDVLAALDRARRPLRMSDLSDALRVSNGNVTGIVDRLAADGLVMRVARQGDRRAVEVSLTAPGAAEFARLAALHASWIDACFARVGPGELLQAIALLDRIGP